MRSRFMFATGATLIIAAAAIQAQGTTTGNVASFSKNDYGWSNSFGFKF